MNLLSLLWLVNSVRGAGASYNLTLLSRVTGLLDSLLEDYDRKLRPSHGGPPEHVAVHITVLNIGPVSEKDMEFSMDCYFRQSWLDPRLKFNKDPFPSLSLASKVLKEIWSPDTYIRNGRASYLHTLTVPNVLVRVRHDGLVYVSQRLTIRTRCPMYLRKFPMDTQICPVSIGSLGFDLSEIRYRWVKLDTVKNIDLSQYEVLGHWNLSADIPDPRGPPYLGSSTIQAYFELERQQGFYILQMYTPCTLIVVMSWVSFWINKEASPARVGLGIMTVLTMSTLGLGGRDDLPKISYSTALDLYIVACFGFVFASLVEYAVINFAYMVYVNRRLAQMNLFSAATTYVPQPSDNAPESAARRRLRRMCCGRVRESAALVYERKMEALAEWRMEWGVLRVERIDGMAKVLFPSLYIGFNAVYWWAFLYWIPDDVHKHLTLDPRLKHVRS